MLPAGLLYYETSYLLHSTYLSNATSIIKTTTTPDIKRILTPINHHVPKKFTTEICGFYYIVS
jgi:hypothetical protein